MMKTVFSSYDAAVILNVDISTVKKWADEGKIKAFKTPGGHRRISRGDLEDFARKYNFPLSGLEETPPKILIVDDEKNIREKVSRTLKKRFPDAVVQSAADGFTAGRVLAGGDISVLILDIRLPGIDGYEVMRQLRRDETLGNPYTIIITGYSEDGMKAEMLRLGADLILLKPFGLKEVADAVEKAINN